MAAGEIRGLFNRAYSAGAEPAAARHPARTASACVTSTAELVAAQCSGRPDLRALVTL
jgi:hypothetical protein